MAAYADPNRCDRGFVGNTIGQANAVSDKVLDLRNCLYKDADLQKKVLSGALMSGADYTGANMQVCTPLCIVTSSYCLRTFVFHDHLSFILPSELLHAAFNVLGKQQLRIFLYMQGTIPCPVTVVVLLTVVSMQEAVLTKAYAVDANFSNADMTNAVIDRVDFTGAVANAHLE